MNPKIKNILTNQYFILIIIFFLGLLIRLLNIDKPYGLWSDEIWCYTLASKGLPLGIFKALLVYDYHMPLYYYYLGIWIKFFGSNDIILRLSSVLWGVLSIPAFFYLGKTYKSKSLGYFMAIIACLSPVMIYYSQELRFYSMLICFSAISLIFFLKILEAPNKKKFFLFGASSLVILYIYTLGATLVFIEWFILFFHFILNKKDYLPLFLRFSLILFIFSIPYIVLLLIYQTASVNQLAPAFSWGGEPTFEPLSLINDWFSPFLTNIKDGVGINRFYYYFREAKTGLYVMFLTSSTACFTLGFFLNFKAINKKILYLLAIFSFLFLVEIYLWSQGDFHIVTRYTLIILPIALLLGSNGLLSINIRYLKYFLISVILIVFTYNIINYKNADSFAMRYDGFKFPSDEIMKLNPDEDYLLYSKHGGDLFLKYLKKIRIIDIQANRIFNLDKTKKEALKLFDKYLISTTDNSNAADKLSPYFLSYDTTIQLKQFMNSALNKIPKGKKLILVEGPYGDVPTETGRYFTMQYLQNNVSKKFYNQILLGIASNKLRMDIKNLLDSNHSLKLIGHTQIVANSKEIFNQATWRFYIYKKISD